MRTLTCLAYGILVPDSIAPKAEEELDGMLLAPNLRTIIRMTEPNRGDMEYVIRLNEAQSARLQALAAARRKTPEQCLEDFVNSCQPGGSGWEPPERAAKPKGKGEAP